MRLATRELARLGRSLVISGHSAGGHLAACLLATDWPAFDASLPGDLVTAVYAISGLFDLGPLVETSINKALSLDQAVNEGFLKRLACLGGGCCELVESEDRLDAVMDRVHRRIGTPGPKP